MSETKFTPGPWSISKTNGRVVLNRDGGKVAIAQSSTIGPEAWANARLIAAAPQMYEAAKKWLAHYDKFVRQESLGDEPGISELRTALAAATGGEK